VRLCALIPIHIHPHTHTRTQRLTQTHTHTHTHTGAILGREQVIELALIAREGGHATHPTAHLYHHPTTTTTTINTTATATGPDEHKHDGDGDGDDDEGVVISRATPRRGSIGGRPSAPGGRPNAVTPVSRIAVIKENTKSSSPSTGKTRITQDFYLYSSVQNSHIFPVECITPISHGINPFIPEAIVLYNIT
jgi:hypothetical protein